jgi:type II restriction enzyme
MNYRRVSILKNGLINAKQFRELGKFAEKVGSALRTVKVDVFLEDQKGSIFLLDLKTAKPNISNFKDFKRTLLEWCAILLTKTPDVDVHSLIAIPYNPYEPAPYERWTLKGMLDLDRELKVADEFWDFLGGEEAYQELLDCFERVGCELRPEIDRYFEGFRVSSHSSTGDVH